jgi:iron complex outermembrane recepter protein
MLREKSLSISIGLLTLTIAYPGAVLAQEAGQAQVVLEGITVFTASRGSAEQLKETPSTVDVIDEKELDVVKFADSRKELLSRIPGNSMVRNLRFPMGDKNYTVNLIDGLTVSGFGRGNNVFIDSTNSWDISSIEVVKGPASSLYGSNAIGGVINIITKEPPKTPEYRVWGEGGSYDRYRGGLTAGATIGAIGYYVDANTMDIKGWQDRTASQRDAVSGKTVVTIDNTSSVTFRGEKLHNYQEDPGTLTKSQFDQNWRQANIKDAFTESDMLSASSAYTKNFTAQSELKFAYSIRSNDQHGTPSYSSTGAYIDTTELNHNFVTSYRQDYDFWRTRLIGGADFQYSDVLEGTHKTRDTSSPLASEWNSLATVASPFGQFEFSPMTPLRFTFGGRYDWNQYEGIGGNVGKPTTDTALIYTHFSPKAGATYQINDNTTVWAGYGQGFVVPSRTYLFGGSRSGAVLIDANPGLSPETAENYEVGLRGAIPDLKFRYDVSLYNTDIADMLVIEQDTLTHGTAVNAGQVRGRGVETTASYAPVDFLKFSASYTYAENKYMDFVTQNKNYSGNELVSSPHHHLNSRVTVTPIKNLDVELEWDKISSYYTNIDNASDKSGQATRPDLFHLRVKYDMGAYSIWAAARNITNEKYAERIVSSANTRAYTVGEPTGVYAGIAWKTGGDQTPIVEDKPEAALTHKKLLK